MTRQSPATSPIASPCINICQIDRASGLCAGCLRTIAEISAWGKMDDEARRALMTQLRDRRLAPRD
ncbi:MAG: DUF1289 domain-containing protein [Paracoccus sp. (in: a-proteobacteria)]|nr:DUF1289 domain-containing protein [Paracoccus sp. (in: a-proteobacteria)]